MMFLDLEIQLDTVSQRVLESVGDELHRQFDEDKWSIRFQNSEEEMGLEEII